MAIHENEAGCEHAGKATHSEEIQMKTGKDEACRNVVSRYE
jgi:hypothetical protein